MFTEAETPLSWWQSDREKAVFVVVQLVLLNYK